MTITLDERQTEAIVRGLSALSMLVLGGDDDISIDSVRLSLADFGVTPQQLTLTAYDVREAWRGR